METFSQERIDEIAIDYLKYLTWEKVFVCGKTFPQILTSYFNENIDLGFRSFLYHIFLEYQTNLMKQVPQVLFWIEVNHNNMTSVQKSKLLFSIKNIVSTKSHDEIKEIVELFEMTLNKMTLNEMTLNEKLKSFIIHIKSYTIEKMTERNENLHVIEEEDDDFMKPEICGELLEIGKMYLKYFTLDKIHVFMFPPPVLRSFQEIVDQEFDGDLDEAMSEFLIPEIHYITCECILYWMSENDILINGSCRDLLFIMKQFVRNCSLDELKFVCGIEEICLK